MRQCCVEQGTCVFSPVTSVEYLACVVNSLDFVFYHPRNKEISCLAGYLHSPVI